MIYDNKNIFYYLPLGHISFKMTVASSPETVTLRLAAASPAEVRPGPHRNGTMRLVTTSSAQARKKPLREVGVGLRVPAVHEGLRGEVGRPEKLAGDGDGASRRGVAGGDEKENLGFRVRV
jgi:hypothetical protein